MSAARDNLRPGWRRVRFGEVVRQVKTCVEPESSGLERYVAGEHMDSEDLHIRRWGTIGEGYLGPAFHRPFKPGQTLYGSRRTYLKKVAFAEFAGICANTTLVLEPFDPQVLLPELLPFLMLTDDFTAFSIRESKGSVNPYINFTDIARYEFPLPPRDEQRRLANLLWAADEVHMRHAHMGSDLTKLEESIALSELWCGFDGMGDPCDNAQSLSRIIMPLGVCSKVIDPNPSHRYPESEEDGVPLVSTENFSDMDDYDFTKCRLVSRDTHEEQMSRCDYQPTDIVFARKGVVGHARFYGTGIKCFSHTVVLIGTTGIFVGEWGGVVAGWR